MKNRLCEASFLRREELLTEVALTFSFELLLRLWSQIGDLLFSESARLNGIAGGVFSP